LFRNRRYRFVTIILGLLTPLGVVLALTAGPASAGTRPAHAIFNSPTAACTAEFGTCPEPVVAQALPSTDDLVPGDDAAMTVTGPAGLIGISADNDQQDGSQDWQIAQIASVPGIGGGPGAFGFNGFDRHNYGHDPVVEVEWTPFGFDSGLCAQKTPRNQVRLALCDGGADQAYIITRHVPLAGFAPTVYAWVLSVQHVVDAQEHLALAAPRFLTGAPLVFSRAVHVAAGHGGDQFWSTI
jgi:hypothetical protein